MTEKVYSLDGEKFYDYASFMSDVLHEHKQGETVEVYVGIKREIKHSDFVSADVIIESAQEMAYDEYGEISNDYLEKITEAQGEELKRLICAWLDKTVGQPRFYAFEKVSIENIGRENENVGR